jgi:two-component system, NarL family, nitrate/nitrite response regulator NarL
MADIQVLVVDQHGLSREGLRLLLTGEIYDVTCATPSLEAALPEIKRGARPGLLVLVVHDCGQIFQGASETAALQQIRTILPECKIVLIARDTISAALLGRAIAGGANALLSGDMSGDVLMRSLHLVMLGQDIFPALPEAEPKDEAEAAGTAEDFAEFRPVAGMSESENRVLRNLLRGHTNKMIARELDISEATVKIHMKAVLRKLKVRNRTQAAMWAATNGMSSTA